MKSSRTFQEIMAATAHAAARRLMDKAVLANRVAKAAPTMAGRRRAYRIKTAALEQAIRKFPERLRVTSVEAGGDVVGVRLLGGAALHLRRDRCDQATAAWIEEGLWERAESRLRRGTARRGAGASQVIVPVGAVRRVA